MRFLVCEVVWLLKFKQHSGVKFHAGIRGTKCRHKDITVTIAPSLVLRSCAFNFDGLSCRYLSIHFGKILSCVTFNEKTFIIIHHMLAVSIFVMLDTHWAPLQPISTGHLHDHYYSSAVITKIISFRYSGWHLWRHLCLHPEMMASCKPIYGFNLNSNAFQIFSEEQASLVYCLETTKLPYGYLDQLLSFQFIVMWLRHFPFHHTHLSHHTWPHKSLILPDLDTLILM